MNAMMASVLENRELIETTLGRLRREKYDEEDFKALSWVCFFFGGWKISRVSYAHAGLDWSVLG